MLFNIFLLLEINLEELRGWQTVTYFLFSYWHKSSFKFLTKNRERKLKETHIIIVVMSLRTLPKDFLSSVLTWIRRRRNGKFNKEPSWLLLNTTIEARLMKSFAYSNCVLHNAKDRLSRQWKWEWGWMRHSLMTC